MRSAKGQNYILDLLAPKKKSEADNIPKLQLDEQKRTNELLEKLDPNPLVLGKGR